MYFNPKFDQKDLNKERKVVCEEIHESMDDPFDVLCAAANASSLSGSQFANEILGTKKSLSKMDSALLQAYHDKWYIAQNTVVCFAGNISIRKAEELVNKYFEPNFEKKELEKVECNTAEFKSEATTKKKDIAQSHLLFTFPDMLNGKDNKQKEVVSVLTLILDGGMSSRLFQNIREKLGVCYSIGCIRSSYKNNGRLQIYTSTSPSKVELTVKAIRHELDKLKEFGVTDEELIKAKEQAKTTFVFAEERTKSVMSNFAIKELCDDEFYDPDARLKLIDEVTKEEVIIAAREIFNYDNLCTALVAKNTKVDILKMFKE